MSDFFSEDFFAPLNEGYEHPDKPSLGELQDKSVGPTAPAARAPAQVLFEVQNELWTLVGDLEHAHVLKGREREEFLRDLEQSYRKLQRYLRSRTDG